jgi:hypothetical protein
VAAATVLATIAGALPAAEVARIRIVEALAYGRGVLRRGITSSRRMSQGVTCPILFPPYSTNQMFPSGPDAIPRGWQPAVGIVNWTIAPAVVILPTLFPYCSLNQRFPSGPDAIP